MCNESKHLFCFWYKCVIYLFSRWITLLRPPSLPSTLWSFSQRISTLLRFKLDLGFCPNIWLSISECLGHSCLLEKNVCPFLSIPTEWLSSLLFWLSNQEMDFINFSLQSRGCTWGDPKSHSNISSKGRQMLCGKSHRGGKKERGREEMKSGFDEHFSQASPLERCQRWWSSSSSGFHRQSGMHCNTAQPPSR